MSTCEKAEWIQTKIRIPELVYTEEYDYEGVGKQSESVLITTSEGELDVARYQCSLWSDGCFEESWVRENDSIEYDCKDVIAWMPLPEPYKEQERA